MVRVGVVAWGLLAALTSPAFAATSTRALGLEDLVREALEKNKQVHIDAVRVGEARALHEYAAAQAYPRLSAQALFGGPTPETRTVTKNQIEPATEASYEGDFNFGELGVTFRLGGELIVPIYTFGKIERAKTAASHLIRAAEHKVDITAAEVAVNVYRAYWAHQLTRSFASSLAEGDEILSKVLEKVEELLENDSPQVTENDRLRLIHAQATVKVRLAEAQNATGLALAAIKLLLGRDQRAPLAIVEGDIEAIPATPPSLDASLASAVEHRPELRALAELVTAHERFAEFRWLEMMPDLFLGGFLEYAATTNATDHTNPFVRDDFNFLNLGIGVGMKVSLDVFNRVAVARQAEAALETRLAESAAAAEAIELEIRALSSDQRSRYERIELLQRALRAARGWLNASVLAYDIGTGDAGELIDAFLARATAEGELRKTQFDVQVGVAELSRAAGTLVRDARHP